MTANETNKDTANVGKCPIDHGAATTLKASHCA